MTKKKTIVIVLVAVVALLGAAGAVYAIRNINEKPPIVVEQNVETAPQEGGTPLANTTVISSSFNGVDVVHWGRGGLDIIKTDARATLSFKEDFEVAQGPDLFVYLSPNPAGQELGEFASLGNLKANKGIQEYTLRDNYQDYKTVVIWCRAFGTTFATADI